MTKKKQSFKQKKFMRRVRFGKGNHVELWKRRHGKTYTILNLVKPMFKRQNKKIQVFKLCTVMPIIDENTEIVLLDEFTFNVYDKIRKQNPNVRVIGVSTK